MLSLFVWPRVITLSGFCCTCTMILVYGSLNCVAVSLVGRQPSLLRTTCQSNIFMINLFFRFSSFLSIFNLFSLFYFGHFQVQAALVIGDLFICNFVYMPSWCQFHQHLPARFSYKILAPKPQSNCKSCQKGRSYEKSAQKMLMKLTAEMASFLEPIL